MRTMGKTIGYLLFFLSGISMFIFWVSALENWLGFIGIMLAIFLTPGLVLFPIIFWIVEGVFPLFYFIVWGVGIVGAIIGGLSSENN